jgi:hypothetical protein
LIFTAAAAAIAARAGFSFNHWSPTP